MRFAGYIIIAVIVIALAIFLWAYLKVTKNEKHVADFKNFADTHPIDSTIKVTLTEYPVSTQFAVAVINKDDIQVMGYEKRSDGIEEIDNREKVFEIGSITKTFTAALAAHCFNNGSLDTQTSLKNIFSFTLPQEVGNITLLQLSNHTSGLPRLPLNMQLTSAENPYANYDTVLMFEYLKKARLQNKSGKVYSYSNLGMALLGEICARDLKMSYDEAIQHFLLTPLKMEHSTVTLNNLQKNNLVKALDAKGKETSNWSFKSMAGAGGINSTLSDMIKYAKANMDSTNGLLERSHQSTFKVNNNMSLGMGWHILHRGNSDILFHNGGTGGYRSCLMISKQEQKAVIVLTNVSAFHPKAEMIDILCEKLLEKS